MVNLIPTKIKRIFVKGNLKKEFFDGIGFAIILLLVCMILISNIIRVIQKGIDNYNVYEYEANLLEEAQKKHEDLQDELAYFSSEETKKLLAREVLNLGQPGETLYTIKDEVKFYEQEKKIVEVNETDLRSWWSSLIKL